MLGPGLLAAGEPFAEALLELRAAQRPEQRRIALMATLAGLPVPIEGAAAAVSSLDSRVPISSSSVCSFVAARKAALAQARKGLELLAKIALRDPQVGAGGVAHIRSHFGTLLDLALTDSSEQVRRLRCTLPQSD